MALADQIFLVLLGFGIVLVVLAMLWLVSAAVGRVFVVREGALARAASAAAGPPLTSATGAASAAGPAVAQGVPAAHVAAISAAVAVLTEGRGRVVSVHLPPHRVEAWANSGRIEQYSAHHLHYNWTIPGPPHIQHDGVVHHEPPPPPTRSSK